LATILIRIMGLLTDDFLLLFYNSLVMCLFSH